MLLVVGTLEFKNIFFKTVECLQLCGTFLALRDLSLLVCDVCLERRAAFTTHIHCWVPGGDVYIRLSVARLTAVSLKPGTVDDLET